VTSCDRLRRADWRVAACSQVDAVEFITRTHYALGAPNTSVARHALYERDSEKLRGVALWLPPTKVAAASVAGDDWRGVLSLSRLCIDDEVPRNGASYLLGASMRMLDRSRWPTLLTYADTREGHTGAIYRATNWRCVGEVPGTDTWQHAETGERRGRKRAGWNYTAEQMRDLGYVHLQRVPKIKYVHDLRRVGTCPRVYVRA
jgi:hypothetical protein